MSVGIVDKQTGERIPTAGMPAVDSVLSGTSTNPVQNRVVKAALDAITDGQSIDSFADVETALGEKADTDIVASDFSAATSYTAGEYCIYGGKFYKFKNNHSGAWSASDVDEIKIAGELSSLMSGLTNLIKSAEFTVTTDGSGNAKLSSDIKQIIAVAGYTVESGTLYRVRPFWLNNPSASSLIGTYIEVTNAVDHEHIVNTVLSGVYYYI